MTITKYEWGGGVEKGNGRKADPRVERGPQRLEHGFWSLIGLNVGLDCPAGYFFLSAGIPRLFKIRGGG